MDARVPEISASGPGVSSEQVADLFDVMRFIATSATKAVEDWAAEREINYAQGLVLNYLVRHPGVIQRDIARMRHHTAAGVTSLLHGLQRRGLIVRRVDAKDERMKRVYRHVGRIETDRRFRRGNGRGRSLDLGSARPLRVRDAGIAPGQDCGRVAASIVAAPTRVNGG